MLGNLARQHTTPKVMEWWNVSIELFYNFCGHNYVDKQSDWERYLPLVLYAYRTSVHSSTGSSPLHAHVWPTSYTYTFLLSDSVRYGLLPGSPSFQTGRVKGFC